MIYIEEMKNTIANNNAFGHLQPKPNQAQAGGATDAPTRVGVLMTCNF